MKLFGNFNKPIRLGKNILKTIVRLQGLMGILRVKEALKELICIKTGVHLS